MKKIIKFFRNLFYKKSTKIRRFSTDPGNCESMIKYDEGSFTLEPGRYHVESGKPIKLIIEENK